jgi:type IV secretory pathway VirB2 component (pilin)
MISCGILYRNGVLGPPNIRWCQSRICQASFLSKVSSRKVLPSGMLYSLGDSMLGCYSSQEYHADEKLLDITIESGYVCATSSRFDVLREVQMPRWSSVSLVRQIQLVTRSKSALTAAAFLTLLLVTPVGAMAQGSPFDTGFTAIQSLFTGTIAKVASLVAIVIGGYGFAHGEPGAKKALAGVAAGTGIAVLAVNVLSWLWGV